MCGGGCGLCDVRWRCVQERRGERVAVGCEDADVREGG